jgi:hypothetical protein
VQGKGRVLQGLTSGRVVGWIWCLCKKGVYGGGATQSDRGSGDTGATDAHASRVLAVTCRGQRPVLARVLTAVPTDSGSPKKLDHYCCLHAASRWAPTVNSSAHCCSNMDPIWSHFNTKRAPLCRLTDLLALLIQTTAMLAAISGDGNTWHNHCASQYMFSHKRRQCRETTPCPAKGAAQKAAAGWAASAGREHGTRAGRHLGR